MNKNYVLGGITERSCFTAHFKESLTRMVKFVRKDYTTVNIEIKTKNKNSKILTKNRMGFRKETIDTPLYRTLFGGQTKCLALS